MKWVIFFVLFIISFYRCFFNLYQRPIEQWDEQTNISVISDSKERKSFPILYLGNSPFFEKPPLWYYFSFSIEPRLLSSVAGFLVILITVYFSWKWWGLFSSVITWVILLATNHLFITNPGGFFSTHTFRSADVDSLFMLFLVLSFFVKNMKLQGVFAGLAVLTKGPLGVLPLLVNKAPVKSWIIAIGIISPWYLLISYLFGVQFWQEHLGYHAVTRILLPIEGHNNPMWYYVSIITNRAFFPTWELLLFSLCWIFINKKLKDDMHAKQIAFLTILFFLIPTFSQTRLAWYILPIYPFAALTIGYAVSEVTTRFRKYILQAHLQ